MRMLESRDFIPKYDGSDISSCDKAGYRDSFDKYAGRVDAWLSKQCKEQIMSDGCCGGNSSSCSSDSNPVSDNSTKQDGCTNDASTCDNDPCCQKDN